MLTVEDLVAWLRERGPPFEQLLADASRIRAAVDLEHARPGDNIFGAREVALFSPVSGL